MFIDTSMRGDEMVACCPRGTLFGLVKAASFWGALGSVSLLGPLWDRSYDASVCMQIHMAKTVRAQPRSVIPGTGLVSRHKNLTLCGS
jgi:hypothetical protein